MKRSRLLTVFIVALLVLSAIPPRQTQSQGPYTEKLSVFVAGSDALWYFNFGGVNGSRSLSGLESTPGLSWYNVTAIDTASWQSDFQVFGSKGYNLLPVPFVPSQGMFLTLGSDSYTDATAAATALDSYLLTNFVSLSNGTGIYSFYSSVSFSSLMPLTLLKFLPTSEHGFASVFSSFDFSSSTSPFIVLEGTKSSSGFNHNLVVGSISASALDTSGRPNVLGYFGSSVTSLRASTHSASSIIQLRFLDGIVKSSDKATVVSTGSSFMGSYTINLEAGKIISTFNATVVQQTAPLLATRVVDVGVLHSNGNVSVTLTFKNLSPSETITKLSFTDNWWSKTGLFKFVKGQDNVSSISLASGVSVTPVYRLQYTGTTTGGITIPPSVVRYQYTAHGQAFNATTILNPIRLSLNVDDAVLYAILTPTGNLGKPAGTPQSLNVTVVNVGTLPASPVVVAGKSIAGLAAKTGSSPGGTVTVTVTQSVTNLALVNFTKSYVATYQNPSGTSLNVTTNVVSDVFSHTSMKIGFPVLTVGVTLKALSSLENNVAISFASANLASANVTAFKASGVLPAGLGCGKVIGKGIACSGNRVTLTYRVLNASSTAKASLSYNLTNSANYLIAPFIFQGVTSGANITGRSNPVALPGGLQLSKQFSPAQLFGGMNSEVKVMAFNAGPLPIYNATITSTIDLFDTLTSANTLAKKVSSISPGGNATFSYEVAMSQTYGNLTGVPPTASFYFGGTSYLVQGLGPKVDIYQPLSATITTNPASPEEGKNFTINFRITNPSAVQVSNATFTLPVPPGLGLSNLRNAQVSQGVLRISAGALGAHSFAMASVVAVASSGITIPFERAKLTFTYAGVTINGVVPKASGIAIAEDVTTRYVIPTAFVLLAALAVAFYVRKKASSVPASPK